MQQSGSNGGQGIIVSNHGARQLDDAPSPLTMLPAIKAAVAALGQDGADQVLAIMRKEIDAILTQIDCGDFSKLDGRYLQPSR